MPRTLTAVLCLLFLLLPIVAGLADGDSRPATPEEQAFSQRLREGMAGAFPTRPAGWTESQSPDKSAIERTFPGAEAQPFRVECDAEWQNDEAIAKAGEAEAKAMDKLAQSDALKPTADYEAAMKKVTELSTKLGEAISKGDMAAAEAIQKELQPIQEMMEKTGQQQAALINTTMKPLQARDTRISLHLQVNAGTWDAGKAVKIADTAGCPTWREEVEGDNPTWDSVTTVFLGRWKETQTEYGPSNLAAFDLAKPSCTAQNILVTIRADKPRADALLKEIRWDHLKGLLDK